MNILNVTYLYERVSHFNSPQNPKEEILCILRPQNSSRLLMLVTGPSNRRKLRGAICQWPIMAAGPRPTHYAFDLSREQLIRRKVSVQARFCRTMITCCMSRSWRLAIVASTSAVMWPGLVRTEKNTSFSPWTNVLPYMILKRNTSAGDLPATGHRLWFIHQTSTLTTTTVVRTSTDNTLLKQT